MEIKLMRLSETETEKGMSASATFVSQDDIGGLVKLNVVLKGDKAALDSYLRNLGASQLDSVIEVQLTPSKQTKLS